MSGLELEPLTVEPAIGASLDHVVCCYDYLGSVSFCGCNVVDLPWGDGERTCVVCVELENSEFCPRFGRCRDLES